MIAPVRTAIDAPVEPLRSAPASAFWTLWEKQNHNNWTQANYSKNDKNANPTGEKFNQHHQAKKHNGVEAKARYELDRYHNFSLFLDGLLEPFRPFGEIHVAADEPE
jgi:hypothetical protein